MLTDITTELPLFEEYRSIFPNAHELEGPLRELYNDYVTFCIDTFLFFKSKKWCESCLDQILDTPGLTRCSALNETLLRQPQAAI